MGLERDELRRLLDLERKVDFLLKEFGLEEKVQQYMAAPDLDDVLMLVKGNRKLEAIKLYIQRTGVSLSEAKSAIEQLQKKL